MDFLALIILAALSAPAPAPAPGGVAISACPSPVIPALPRVRAQVSGIEGKVYLLSGNRMPSPPRRPGDTIRRSTGGQGVKATVCVFGLTNDSEVTRQGTSPWCEAIHTRLIRQADTDDKGNFTIQLPPGTYSVFTKKGNLFYASRRDEKNNIAPVKILPGKMTRIDCSVESNQKVVY